MEQDEITKEVLMKEKEVDKRILAIQRKEEVELRLKSTCLWLKDGDQNSKFFHYQCKVQNRKNIIKEILKENGQKITESKKISREIKEHFEDMYTSEDNVSQEEMVTLGNEIPKL